MIDTKKARAFEDCHNEECEALVVDLCDEVELLRKQNWQARQKIGTLEQEVERLKLEVDWLQTPMRKRHEALLAAAKKVQAAWPNGPLGEAIDACEKEDHRKHIDLCREQVVELLEAKTKEVGHEDE